MEKEKEQTQTLFTKNINEITTDTIETKAVESEPKEETEIDFVSMDEAERSEYFVGMDRLRLSNPNKDKLDRLLIKVKNSEDKLEEQYKAKQGMTNSEISVDMDKAYNEEVEKLEAKHNENLNNLYNFIEERKKKNKTQTILKIIFFPIFLILLILGTNHL